MHMKMANAIIALRDGDSVPDSDKKMLLVRMNGQSKMESENNVIVKSVVNDSFEEAKKGVKELTKIIKKTI